MRIVIVFILYLFYSQWIQSQSIGNISCDSLVQNISFYAQEYSQEKVYLHFDNTNYYLGEKIWYSAYVVEADGWKPVEKSRILYVDLLTQEGYLVKRNRHYIEKGLCHGSFELSDSLNAGYYEVRAYTAWMLNFGRIPNKFVHKKKEEAPEIYSFHLPMQEEKYFCENPCVFSRVFPVYNAVADGNYNVRQIRLRSQINNHGGLKVRVPNIQMKFFPEGGHLIKGQISRVAYELKNEEGLPLNIPIHIQTVSGEILDSFSPQHRGKGTFIITPEMWKIGITKCRLVCEYAKKKISI